VKAHATGNPEPLTEFAVIETEDAFKCETYLHHRLRSKRSTRSDATEFFEVDPDELSALVDDARNYVNEVLPIIAEAERLSEESWDDRILQPTEGVLETYRELVRVREQHDTLGFQKDHLEAELKLAIGTASGIERVADWKSVVQQRLDGELLRRERPDLYELCRRETRFRRFSLL
jgi:hypothetical protein